MTASRAGTQRRGSFDLVVAVDDVDLDEGQERLPR